MDLFPTIQASIAPAEEGGGMLGAVGEHPYAASRKSKSSPSTNSEPKRKKKPRMEAVDLPPVQNGVISASKTPTIDENRLVNVEIRKMRTIEETVTREFFDDGDDGQPLLTKDEDIPEYKIADSVIRLLESKAASEEELRDAIFTDLVDNHEISFFDSSLSDQTDQHGNKKYTEAVLNKLLLEFGKKSFGVQDGNMARIMRGLPVTTTSKPDLVPLDNGGADGASQLWMGEFKNHQNYKEENARSKCLMYLIALLYWLRTVIGRPVESVYGFYICGCRCSDQGGETYCVGLLKLSAPQYLGDQLRAACLSKMAFVNDPLPLRLIIHFLKNGKGWTTSPSGPFSIRNPVPCYFVLPTSLWQDDGERKLVLHGTLSIVFHITARGLKDLFQSESSHFQELAHNASWQRYSEDLVNKVNTEDPTKYYLKVRTKNSSWQSMPMGAMHDVWDLLTESQDTSVAISDLYIDKPFVTETFGLVLMRDKGSRIREVALDFNRKILKEFSKIRKTAIALNKILPHGDILPHNLVFDMTTQEMTLIDMDEGVERTDTDTTHILKRKNTYLETDYDWFIAISYPNPLRNNAALYTKAQLLASFLFLMRRINNVPPQFLAEFEALVEKAGKLGAELCAVDKKDREVGDLFGRTVEKSLTEADDAVTKMIAGITNHNI